MASYQMGQYIYGNDNCINNVYGEKEYVSVSVEGTETTTSSFQDVMISPAGGVFLKDQDYYAKVMIPQDMNYDMSFNLKLVHKSATDDSFQFLKKVTIKRGGSGNNVYPVVLYEQTDGRTVDARVPKTYISTQNAVKDEVYYEANTGKYYIGVTTGSRSYRPLINYNDVSVIASWKQEETENYGVFEVIFRPIDEGFTHLFIQMIRTAEDYNIQSLNNATGQIEYGRKIDLVKMRPELYRITNLVPYMTSADHLDKIGVWGHPGLNLVVNGEEIKIGPSGHYEIGILPIETLGVVCNNYRDMFTIDYQYTP